MQSPLPPIVECILYSCVKSLSMYMMTCTWVPHMEKVGDSDTITNCLITVNAPGDHNGAGLIGPCMVVKK